MLLNNAPENRTGLLHHCTVVRLPLGQSQDAHSQDAHEEECASIEHQCRCYVQRAADSSCRLQTTRPYHNFTAHDSRTRLLQGDEARAVGGTDTGATVLDGLVADGELGEVVADHLGLASELKEHQEGRSRFWTCARCACTWCAVWCCGSVI